MQTVSPTPCVAHAAALGFEAFTSPLRAFRVGAGIRFCVVNSYLASYLDTLCSMYILNIFFFHLSFMQLPKTYEAIPNQSRITKMHGVIGMVFKVCIIGTLGKFP